LNSIFGYSKHLQGKVQPKLDLVHFSNALFATPDGGTLDANRVMSELDRALDEQASLKKGIIRTTYSRQRMPLQHVRATLLRVPETNNVIDISLKAAELEELRAKNEDLKLQIFQIPVANRYIFMKRELEKKTLFAFTDTKALRDSCECILQEFQKLSNNCSRIEAVERINHLSRSGLLAL
jgi:hypothetical protein